MWINIDSSEPFDNVEASRCLFQTDIILLKTMKK